jgi:putative endopeptidase
MRLCGWLQREGCAGPLAAQVWVDRGDATRYRLYLAQGGIGLPDESYYREPDREAIRAAYVAHIARMLTLSGATEYFPPSHRDLSVDEAARLVMDLETRLAASHWDTVASRDAVKTYNPHSAEQMQALLPTWSAWAEGHGVPEVGLGELVVVQPDALAGLTSALEEVPLADWQLWLLWTLVRSAASYLHSDLVDEQFAFYGTTLTGAPALRERWKRGVALVEAALGEAVGRLYVDRYYPPKAQERMSELVAMLVEAYRERIAVLEWMGPDTRARALEKLAAITTKIGMPVRWRDYSQVEVIPGDLLGNARRAGAAETDRNLRKLGGPIDRDEWFMTPQTVNAYYNPAMNEIVFPAAVLQPPLFDLDGDDAYNYGAIGAVIGHEIGHAFDDQGSRYDADGNLRDWWTAEDRDRFERRTAALIAQYDGFSPRDTPDHHVNGALTVGENIGDLGGVEVALHAYQLSLRGKPAPELDGMTGAQRFFTGWARVWRMATRQEEALRRLTIDPHSPAEFRANVVRNVDQFHEAYRTGDGDDLWLDPQERVRIW